MKDESMSQQQDQAVNRNDPAIDPQVPGENAGEAEPKTTESDSAETEVDQKHHNTDNDNTFSPGFKPAPDRPTPGEDTDADIDTDGG